MDGSVGFRVQVQEETLTTGQCRVKPTTVATVIGRRYVLAAAGGPVNLALTDSSDSSAWQVQLAWDGLKHYVVNGLRPWLAHCRAAIGAAIEIFREANDPRLHILLVRRQVRTTASAPPGHGANEQQLPSQRASLLVSEWATEEVAAAALPANQHTGVAGGATGESAHASSPILGSCPSRNAPECICTTVQQHAESLLRIASECLWGLSPCVSGAHHV